MAAARSFQLPKSDTAWRIALWMLQVLLAVAFGMAGRAKALTPLPELAKSLAFTADVPGWLVRFIGWAELAGAAGLILPALTRIWPKLTPLAAAALALIMVLAIAFHLLRGEAAMIGGPIVLLVLAAFVAWARMTKAPIAPRP